MRVLVSVIFLFSCCICNVLMVDIHSSGVLIEGDIMLDENKDPWDRLQFSSDPKNNRWPNGIVPYDLNWTEYSLLDLYTIREGMKEIEKGTCIKFIPRKDHPDFIHITSDGGGCWSYLGRKGSGQTLSLMVPHCINRGTVIHELMHALGFWHEHSRPDRDEHVEVLWDNISEDKQDNFAKHVYSWSNWTTFAYDYRSVMHYSAYAFSKGPTLPTLMPKNIQIRLKDLGRAKTVGTLTDIDKMKINTLYECPETGL